ncbi:tetratricopeptide repeat protein [Streptomyces solisilvae]|uniref:tetratricopeptide repeat protein n=1 Tax=Streptomyces malaysiensis TaxID=92644 RepID=UPI003683B35C
MELDPDDVWAITSRARIYQSVGRYEEALAEYTHAIELNSSSASIIADRGYLNRLAGRYEEALADCASAIELDPENSNAITNRGATYRISGQYEEALVDFDRAIELDPGSGWAHYEKTVALYAAQDPDYDIYFARVVEICTPDSSESDPAISDIGNLFLVHCLMSDWAEAEHYLGTFISNGATRGDVTELLTVMNTLRPIVPSAREHLAPFSCRLENALGEFE